jgi:AGZA family xanthine/uracil permease-like MFS transporter
MYTLIKVVKGKLADIHPLMWVVAISFLIYFGQAVLDAAISA